ncbi:hypothetical protein ACQ4M3_05300 [Leptolyngbya sp. AN03gr2]|uniref:hypothetical protein n=1 Tax=unclassified Leptolyngbya TaxID=2650499 RepID=UPI003D314ECB
MYDFELPNELILIAAQAISDNRCGKMRFSMLDTGEYQVLIYLDSSVGSDADDIYFIVRSRSKLPLTCVVADLYSGCIDRPEKQFTSFDDLVQEAIGYYTS